MQQNVLYCCSLFCTILRAVLLNCPYRCFLGHELEEFFKVNWSWAIAVHGLDRQQKLVLLQIVTYEMLRKLHNKRTHLSESILRETALILEILSALPNQRPQSIKQTSFWQILNTHESRLTHYLSSRIPHNLPNILPTYPTSPRLTQHPLD